MTMYKSLVDQSVCRGEMWAWNLLVASVSLRRPQNENTKLKTVVVAYWESIDPTAENTRTQKELKKLPVCPIRASTFFSLDK